MGFLRKIGRKIGRGIRKIGREIRRGFKNTFQKIGPVGTLALYFMMPTIAHRFGTGLENLSKLGNATDANFVMRAAGKLADATFQATKGLGTVHNGITGALSNSLDIITEPFLGQDRGIGSRFSNFLNDKRTDFGLDANNQWVGKAETIIQDSKTNEKTKALYQDMLSDTNKLSKPLEEKGKKSLLRKGTEAAAQQALISTGNLLVNRAFEEEDTGARGAVFGIREEEGTGASRTPLPPAMQTIVAEAGPYNLNTWQQYFSSNLYGTGDPVFQNWHRNDKLRLGA